MKSCRKNSLELLNTFCMNFSDTFGLISLNFFHAFPKLRNVHSCNIK